MESLRRQLDECKQADRAAAEQRSAREQSLQADLAKAREAAMVAESKATAAASEAQRHKVRCGVCWRCTGCAVCMFSLAQQCALTSWCDECKDCAVQLQP